MLTVTVSVAALRWHSLPGSNADAEPAPITVRPWKATSDTIVAPTFTVLRVPPERRRLIGRTPFCCLYPPDPAQHNTRAGQERPTVWPSTGPVNLRCRLFERDGLRPLGRS